MLKTSKDFMEWLGLQVGDRVKIADDIYTLYLTDLGNYYLNCTKYMHSTKDIELIDLLDKDIEILPRPKRVGDLKCKKECDYCPIKAICGYIKLKQLELYTDHTLYDLFNMYIVQASYRLLDQEIYDLLKARLDKEVKE